jgi:germination protein M
MKKFTMILLVLLLMLSGCKHEEEFDKPANLYYLNTDYSGSEIITLFSVEQIESQGLSTNDILKQYLSRSTGAFSHSPYPSGLQVLRTEIISDTMYITLSSHYTSISGLDLTLANACLYKTCTELTGVPKIKILINDGPPENALEILLSPEDFFLKDDSSVN